MGAMTRRDALRLLGFSAVAALAAACQAALPGQPTSPSQPAPTAAPTSVPQPTDTPAQRTSLRIALDVDPDTLDPAGQTNPTVSSIVDFMAETLVRLQPDGTLAPGLARTWDQSPDGRTVTFELRRDVAFHDGTLLTAEAAKQSLQRVLDPQLRVSLRAPFDTNLIDSILPLDPLTLRINLKSASRLLLPKLAATEMAIVSPGHVRAFPDTFNDEPVGTGPYRFKERRKGESVVLERFDAYWGKRPFYPQIQFRIVPEVATRESLLLAEGGTPRLQLRLMHATGRSSQDAMAAQVAGALAGNLHDVGVDTELIGSDWPTFLAAVNVPEDRGTAHMHLFNWSPALLDASQQMTQFMHAYWPPAGLATAHYTNPRVESLVLLASMERDDHKRADLYAEAQRIVWDDAPWIFLWVPSLPIVHSARLKGIGSLPNEHFFAAYAEPA